MATLDPSILKRFSIAGSLIEVAPLKRGHINETYLSRWSTSSGERRYIHQLVNHYVFPNVPLMMKNIEVVTGHIRNKLKAGEGVDGECTLTLIPTTDGQSFVVDDAGEFWRTYDFIDGTISVDFCTSPDQAFRAASAFGRFERYLKDLAPSTLTEAIARFQDSEYRCEQLWQALRADPCGRAKEVSVEIDFVRHGEKLVALFADARRLGKVPVRATHADPKVNNVLLSTKTGEGICIVDLDTCMPGTILYDFGDLCRTTTVPAAEDEQDFSLVQLNRELFEAVARGFLSEFGRGLTDEEIKLLPLAPQLIALTIGIRFLADHINGDKYFRIDHENHNLERARTQFQVVRTMRAEADKMAQLVNICLR